MHNVAGHRETKIRRLIFVIFKCVVALSKENHMFLYNNKLTFFLKSMLFSSHHTPVQWTVDNNIGLYRLANQKALDPTHCRHPTILLQDFCSEVQTVRGNELHLFCAKLFLLYSQRLMSCFLHCNSRNSFFLSLVMTRCGAEIGTHYRPDNKRMRYGL